MPSNEEARPVEPVNEAPNEPVKVTRKKPVFVLMRPKGPEATDEEIQAFLDALTRARLDAEADASAGEPVPGG